MVDTIERTGLKASIKAAHKAHKAGLKASLKAKIAAHKAQKKGYTPVDDTVERTGLKASIKAKAAAHKAHKAGLKASIIAKAAAHKAQKKGNLNFNILSELNFCDLENLVSMNSRRLRVYTLGWPLCKDVHDKRLPEGGSLGVYPCGQPS